MLLEAILLLVILGVMLILPVRRPKNYPPGPPPLPLVGNYFQMDLEDPQRLNKEYYKKYGSLTGLVVPLYKAIIVNGWEALKEMVANEDCQGRPDVCLTRDRFCDGGNYGVLFTEGESWKTQRKFTLHNFRNLGFGRKSHESLIVDEVQEMVKEVEATEGRPHFQEDMFYLTNINITWTLLSGHRYSHSNPDLKLLAKSIREVIHDIKIFGSIAVVFPFIRYLAPVSTGYRSVKNGSKTIRKFAENAIREHKEDRDPDSPCRDLLDSYLEEVENNKENGDSHFTEKHLVGVCMDLLLAGADTSTGHLSFAILFLCIYQEIQEKIYEEILRVIGPDRQVTIDDKPKFVYTEAFLMEVARYRTVAPCYPPHRTMRDTVLGGYNIPKGTVLFPNINSVFFEKEYWGDPKVFRPERFISLEGKIIREERLLPFGKGKRSCLGETLAKMSSFIIITTFVQKFHFKVPEGSSPETNGVPGFTVAPPPYKVIATPRQSAE